MKKTRLIIILSLCCYTLILLVLSVYMLTRVQTLLQSYEIAQPEYAAERQITRLKHAAESGTLDRELTLSDALRAEYDPESPLFCNYIAQLLDSTLTYERGYCDMEGCICYDLLADGVKIAEMIFKSRNERTDLFVFQSADWVPVSVEPVVYTCDLTLAQELTVKMGERIITGQAAEDGMISYHLESLSRLDLTLSDEMGNVQSIADGSAPSVYTQSFILPEELTVRLGGTIVEGENAGDGQRSYRFCSLVELDLTVEDRYGHRAVPAKNTDLTLRTYTATLPTDYKITVGGVELSKEGLEVGYFEEFDYFRSAYSQYYSDGALDGAPGIVTYTFRCLVTDQTGKDVIITAPDGSVIDFDAETGSVSITEQTIRTAPIPSEISEAIDVLKFAETWSLFLHRDLSGARYGFNTMAEYLIKDSDFYKDCYAWATGPDIGMISNHTTDNPPFTDESVGGYLALGENCFVCDVRLNLHITLTKTGQKLVRPLNRTILFVRYDQTDDGADNPRWYALAFWDIVDTEETP